MLLLRSTTVEAIGAIAATIADAAMIEAARSTMTGTMVDTDSQVARRGRNT
jgi:hypothetical protein